MPFGNESNHQFDGATIRGSLAVANNQGGVAAVDYDRFACLVRNAVSVRNQGFYAETIQRAAAASASAGTTQVLYGMAIGLLAGDVVANMSVSQQTAGGTLTLVKLGLTSKAGVLLASSADVKANFGSTGVVTTAMSTPYTVLSDDIYYAAILGVGTTPPALLRGHAGINGFGAVGVGFPSAVTMASQSDLPATATWVASSSGIAYWVGIS